MPQVWKWTPKKEAAALDIFMGELSQVKIAQKHGVSRAVIESWVKHPDFQARIEEHRQHFMQRLMEGDVPYITKEARVVALARKAASASAAYDERTWVKEKRTGPKGTVTNEYFNEAAFNAFRGALDDIAKELGQRVQKVEQHGTFDVNERVSFYMPEPEAPPPEEEHDAPSSHPA